MREARTLPMEGPAQRVRIYVNERDRWKGLPLAHAIVRKAQQLGLAGATVARALEGFGAHHRLHETQLVEVEGNLPVVIEIVDGHEQVARLLPELDTMVSEGLVTIEEVHVVRYRHRPSGTEQP